MSLSKTQTAAVVVVVVVVIVVIVAAVAVSGGDDDEEDDIAIDSYSSDPILWILGNSDGDYDIDEDDIAVIEEVIAAGGSASTYPWCDANNDGTIDEDDVDQVQSMIDGTATTIYYNNMDGDNRSFTVRDEIYAVTVNKCQGEEVTLLLNDVPGDSKIVGGDQQCYKYNNELQLNFGDDAAAGDVLQVGQTNGEVQAEVIYELLEVYGHVEICLGSASSYGTNLENDFGDDPDVSIIRLPSWEDGTLSGVMTYGYLFGGVQQNDIWDNALNYYNWYMSYYQVIVDEVADIPEDERPNILTVYITDCYPGATDQVLSVGSGDYERSEECGADNVGDFFGEGYVDFTLEDMAACATEVGIDIIIVEPSAVYGEDGYEGVVDAVQLCIDELDGYVSTDTEIYSMSFMLTAGPGCVVSYVFFAKVCYPDNEIFSQWDVNEVFQEYLELMGWDDRDDISSTCWAGPGYTTTEI